MFFFVFFDILPSLTKFDQLKIITEDTKNVFSHIS